MRTSLPMLPKWMVPSKWHKKILIQSSSWKGNWRRLTRYWRSRKKERIRTSRRWIISIRRLNIWTTFWTSPVFWTMNSLILWNVWGLFRRSRLLVRTRKRLCWLSTKQSLTVCTRSIGSSSMRKTRWRLIWNISSSRMTSWMKKSKKMRIVKKKSPTN